MKRTSSPSVSVRVFPEAGSLLDVGCNVGATLLGHHMRSPGLKLSGIDISEPAIRLAREALPEADLRVGSAAQLPFEDSTFDWVTCYQVLEHIPAHLRAQALSEMRRVLKPNGRLIIEVPHNGWFSWLDPQNYRFRFQWLYKRLVKSSMREATYSNGISDIVWHEHFDTATLTAAAGDGWFVEERTRSGLFLAPLSDAMRWPFYRTRRYDHWAVKVLARVSEWERRFDFGDASYCVLLVLRRI